eukprot:3384485-Amphidinium_carterae.2
MTAPSKRLPSHPGSEPLSMLTRLIYGWSFAPARCMPWDRAAIISVKSSYSVLRLDSSVLAKRFLAIWSAMC